MDAMEEKLNQVKVHVLIVFIFEENQNFVLCGPVNKTQGWDASPALSIVSLLWKTHTFKQLPQGQHTPQRLLIWPICYHGHCCSHLALGFSK